jgi:hypothetical protein
VIHVHIRRKEAVEEGMGSIVGNIRRGRKKRER